MTGKCILAIAAVGLLLSARPADAQELGQYRDFRLGGSLAAISEVPGVRTADVRSIHQRPASIQELEWRPLYATGVAADPVRDVTLRFYNDQLFRIVITYDRYKTEGLADADLIEALSATYGPAVALTGARARATGRPDTLTDGVAIALWQDNDYSFTLYKGTYPAAFQVVAVSKKLDALANSASLEAVRLDAIEAPEREEARRLKQVADASAEREKARQTNKPAFRP